MRGWEGKPKICLPGELEGVLGDSGGFLNSSGKGTG